jgi:hypothetical protein
MVRGSALGSRKIDHQAEPGLLYDRQVRWLAALEDARGADAGLLPLSKHPTPRFLATSPSCAYVDILNRIERFVFHSRLGIDITRALGATR